MGRERILEKISKELEKENPDECRVVYVLSRIRKYLEATNTQEKYRFLNFYCNWALHTRIDRTKVMEDVFNELVHGDDKHGFIHCEPFLKDFDGFLNDNGLSKIWITGYKNIVSIIHLLVEIYSDTPLYFYPKEKLKLNITNPVPKTTLPEGVDCLMEFNITPE